MNLTWLLVALWAFAVVAFFVFFFRSWGGWRGFLYWVLGMAALIATGVLQVVLMDLSAYAHFVAALEPVGRNLAVVAAVVLVADLAVAVLYTIRHGKPDDSKGDVDSSNRGAFFQSPGSPLMVKRSKVKTLYRSGEYVQMMRFVDGTATKGDWLMFIAVFVALIAFTLVFVGVGMMLVNKVLLAAIFPLGAGHVLYMNVRIALREYREAKQMFASLQRRN